VATCPATIETIISSARRSTRFRAYFRGRAAVKIQRRQIPRTGDKRKEIPCVYYVYIHTYIYIYIYMCINKRSAIFHSGAFKKRKHFRSESSDVSISRILSRAIHSANISHSRESDVLFIKDRRNKRGIKKSDLIGAGVASPRDAREVRGGEYRSANRNRIET